MMTKIIMILYAWFIYCYECIFSIPGLKMKLICFLIILFGVFVNGQIESTTNITNSSSSIMKITNPSVISTPGLTIYPDGRVEFKKDYSPDAATKEFARLMRLYMPCPTKKEK